MTPVVFLGDTLSKIRSFPEAAKREIGFQIDRLQRGLNPNDWKPMSTVGPGVREIRVRTTAGIYRTIYISQLKDGIYILHAFQKKTQKTAKLDLEIARIRLKKLGDQHEKTKI